MFSVNLLVPAVSIARLEFGGRGGVKRKTIAILGDCQPGSWRFFLRKGCASPFELFSPFLGDYRGTHVHSNTWTRRTHQNWNSSSLSRPSTKRTRISNEWVSRDLSSNWNSRVRFFEYSIAVQFEKNIRNHCWLKTFANTSKILRPDIRSEVRTRTRLLFHNDIVR